MSGRNRFLPAETQPCCKRTCLLVGVHCRWRCCIYRQVHWSLSTTSACTRQCWRSRTTTRPRATTPILTGRRTSDDDRTLNRTASTLSRTPLRPDRRSTSWRRTLADIRGLSVRARSPIRTRVVTSRRRRRPTTKWPA